MTLLFTPAAVEERRLKMYLYGAHGTGKTVTALHFPSPAVIDLDGGTDHYASTFTFDRLRTVDSDKVIQSVDDLIADPKDYRTLVIDSFTKFGELLQEKHIRRLRIKKGDSQYVLQPSDYKAIKADIKSFINKLHALDMNIVATAQIKNLYSQDSTEFMKIVGTEPDGPKDAPYLFDVVIQLTYGPEDTRIAKVEKDRTNSLPKSFEFSYQEMAKLFGIKDLERAPVKLRAEKILSQMSNRNVKVKVGSKTLLTAGITGPTLEKVMKQIKGMDKKELKDKLHDDYSIANILDLKEDEAQVFLIDLTSTGENV